MGQLEVHSPALLPWRSHAAEVHVHLGRVDIARELAGRELELAHRLCGPIRQAAAMRVLARTDHRDEALERLSSAAQLLESTPSELETARVHADLGVLLRRHRQPTAARPHLAAALHAATVYGATALAAFARDELVAAGGRPRSPYLRGREALTASELRVARLAADGATNTTIAQTLFLSRKTVEKHLARTYRKPGIESRHELRGGLADPESSRPDNRPGAG